MIKMFCDRCGSENLCKSYVIPRVVEEITIQGEHEKIKDMSVSIVKDDEMDLCQNCQAFLAYIFYIPVEGHDNVC